MNKEDKYKWYFCYFYSTTLSYRIVMIISETYLQIVAPLSLSFQQSIKDSPAGLLSCLIIATDHIVKGAHPLKELSIHILGTAVIGDVNQIHVHGRAIGQRCPT